ncbi:MAG: response regulator, partial [Gammaproteobacteria bacterium]
VFWFELPASILQDGHFGLSDPSTHTSKIDSSDLRQRVLCIDDNPINIKLIKQILAHHSDYDVFDAHEPILGLELALTYQPDLVLLDINMPGMDGYQVLQALRTDPLTQDIPVIAVTASAMKKEIERGLEAGFCAYITKPFDISSFLRTLDEILTKA